ncbi:MAG: class I SAM-dependent methyltransferase [Acidobacteria bacterium]|nr:class I SAM-dependent methyltransferase [Acidobacteriota bacterium]MCI0723367.1 class I SAM-dependent methyltransferase [Acidobacteriota bacterium]
MEIGIGSGLNLPFYPGSITRLSGVDPSAELLSMARRKLTALPFPVELFFRSAEDLPSDDRSFDTAVLTNLDPLQHRRSHAGACRGQASVEARWAAFVR